MSRAEHGQVATIDPVALESVRESALSRTPISLGVRRTASPHEFYRYPARFSPDLAASVIAAFSRPGDVVADYFVGGGTTLVEARRSGRLAIGSDINSLSVFVSDVKTRLYSSDDLDRVAEWCRRVEVDEHGVAVMPVDLQSLGYFRNLMGDELADQRRVLVGAVAALNEIESPKVRALARCVVLRTAQWALDMRQEVPGFEQIQSALGENATATVDAARAATREYRRADQTAGRVGLSHCLVLHQGLPGVAAHPRSSRAPGAEAWCLLRRPIPASMSTITGGKCVAGWRRRFLTT